ncbi:MAG: serine hydrolase domain-containing protein [Ignavibacteriaceae bacterium]
MRKNLFTSVRHQKIFIIIILTFIFSFPACSQTVENNYDFSAIDSLITESIRDKVFPGCVLLISKNGDIIFEKPYGNFTYEKVSHEVKTGTIYDLASLTKVIATTTAAMICTDRRLFSPEDYVADYLPEFASSGKKNVLIKNLLLHNSGLPAWKKFYNRKMTPDEIIKEICSLEPEFEPGRKTLYSDLGMIVLGKVIEKVTEKPLEEFCRENIFIPLKMNDTYFNPPDSLKYRIAPTETDTYWRNRLLHGEVHDETAAMLGGVAGHAGLFSTASDINKLISVILNKGKSDNLQFISEETIRLFTTRHSPENERAYGWDLKSETGSSAGNGFHSSSFGHTGFTGTSIWVDPYRSLSVVFLSNRVYPSRENKKIIKFRPELHDLIIETLK